MRKVRQQKSWKLPFIITFSCVLFVKTAGLTVRVDGDIQESQDICKENIADARPVYHGELLLTNTDNHLPNPGPNYDTEQHLAYKYSWISYTDSTLSTVFYQREKGTRLDMGHRFIANLPAMAYIKASVWDANDDLLGECYIGPNIHLGGDEPNTLVDPVARDIGRIFSRVSCNVPLCRETIKNVVTKCDHDRGFIPELYQPNIYESRHRCVLDPNLRL